MCNPNTAADDYTTKLAFRRFLLRGLKKVQVEFGMLALAHNFLNVADLLRRPSHDRRKKEKQK